MKWDSWVAFIRNHLNIELFRHRSGAVEKPHLTSHHRQGCHGQVSLRACPCLFMAYRAMHGQTSRTRPARDTHPIMIQIYPEAFSTAPGVCRNNGDTGVCRNNGSRCSSPIFPWPDNEPSLIRPYHNCYGIIKSEGFLQIGKG